MLFQYSLFAYDLQCLLCYFHRFGFGFTTQLLAASFFSTGRADFLKG